MPEGIAPVFLPRAGPAVNPIKPGWKALRRKLAHRLFDHREEKQEAVREAGREYEESQGYGSQ